jgi:hypothetical protein
MCLGRSLAPWLSPLLVVNDTVLIYTVGLNSFAAMKSHKWLKMKVNHRQPWSINAKSMSAFLLLGMFHSWSLSELLSLWAVLGLPLMLQVTYCAVTDLSVSQGPCNYFITIRCGSLVWHISLGDLNLVVVKPILSCQLLSVIQNKIKYS